MTAPNRDVDHLLALARDKSVEGRKTLVATISDLFAEESRSLSERERALMSDILAKLIHDFEMKVRSDLAERLATRAAVPHEVVVLLANDAIEVARPILIASAVLEDSDLIEVVRHRTLQHQLAVAVRRELSERVSDALVETGNHDVVKTLLENPSARVSEATMAYLVEESRRVDSYQEPLVRRADLGPELARRLCLWVGAALRSYILTHHDIDPTELDDLLEEATRNPEPASPEEEKARDPARRLAQRLREEGRLKPELLVQALRQGEVNLFEALFAELADLRLRLVRRIAYEPGGEGLVIACRALRIEKPLFTSIFLMSRKGRPGDQRVDPAELTRVISLFDRVRPAAAEVVLKRWRRDPDYLYAIRQIEDAQPRTAAS